MLEITCKPDFKIERPDCVFDSALPDNRDRIFIYEGDDKYLKVLRSNSDDRTRGKIQGGFYELARRLCNQH